jgi:hypothetical protein
LDAVNPDGKVSIELFTGFWCGADKISNDISTMATYDVTEDTHAAGLLKTVSYAKAKVFVDLTPNFISVKVSALKLPCKSFC